MSNKPFREMTDAELCAELGTWERHVETAGGWSSAYFAATQLRAVVIIGNERGLGFVNKYPIRIGSP